MMMDIFENIGMIGGVFGVVVGLIFGTFGVILGILSLFSVVKEKVRSILKSDDTSKHDIAKKKLKALRKGVDLHNNQDVETFIKRLEQEMHDAAINMDFELATILRDEIIALKEKVGK